MTYDEYWTGDADMVKYYRKADLLRRKSANADAWIQGLYVYHAVSRLLPAIGGKSIEPYPDKPFPLYDRMSPEEAERRKMQPALKRMRELAASVNRTIKKEGGEANGSGCRDSGD